jgi:hypothetical protein
VDRRCFIAVVGGGLAFSRDLKAEHHVVSANPLEVAFDLNSLTGRYTSVEDFYVRNHGESPLAAGPTVLFEGEVEKPCQVRQADLVSFRERELGAVLECAGDPVGTLGSQQWLLDGLGF